MKFNLEVTCNVCGSREVAVDLDCGQNVGGIEFRCLNADCGESDSFHEYSEPISLNAAFRIGNGLADEPWHWDRLRDRVSQLDREYNRDNRNARDKRKNRDKRTYQEADMVYVSSWIMDEIREVNYGRYDYSEVCGLRIVEVEEDEEYIEVGVA